MLLQRPTAVVDEEKVRNNIRRIAMKAAKSRANFRPHFKTHQSADIGEWFRDEGVDTIAVSSVKMAEYFAGNGWKDILIAFPFNIHETEVLNRSIIARPGLTIESVETLLYLGRNLKSRADIYLKIDTGYGRTGIRPEQTDLIDNLTTTISNYPTLRLTGLLAHFGSTYNAGNKDEIAQIYRKGLKDLETIRQRLNPSFPNLRISIGDTPGISVLSDFSPADELRPGNFVFYDTMQYLAGSCRAEDIALAVYTPVVALHPERNEAVIHGGAIHLSKDSVNHPVYGTLFGLVAYPQDKGWSHPVEGAYVKSISQEHGIVRFPENEIKNLRIGDFLAILPVHSCLTASLFPAYITTTGKRLEKMQG
ncbi:MAG: D-TA family PLP-dependent enzyme [Bacteroidales bacterium]